MPGSVNPIVLWTSEEAAAATGGRVNHPWAATGVSIDSRAIKSGDLFIALQGTHFDGHSFAAAAFAAGAAAAVVAKPQAPGTDLPFLAVPDTGRALTDLARAARARAGKGTPTHAGARIVAVTGSVGKTGTKEMLKLALSGQGLTTATQGNLNNQLGLPLSLARMPAAARFGVFEIGMNHAGEIGPLSRLARPDVAIVTSVEPAHMEFFSSIEAIAEAKAEIFEGMEAPGIAVLNRDNPHFERLSTRARARGLSIVSFGATRDADYHLADCTIDGQGSRVAALLRDKPVKYRVGPPGRHWALNSLAVLAAVEALGGDLRAAAASLAAMEAPTGRGKRTRIQVEGGSFDLVDESYNANPASMRAAIDTLGAQQPGPGGRRIAILGDMLELGVGSATLHAELAAALTANRIDLVFTAGRKMGHLRDALPASMRGGHAADAGALAALIGCVPRPGDIVIVKGSAGSRMNLIVETLLKLDFFLPAGKGNPRTAHAG